MSPPPSFPPSLPPSLARSLWTESNEEGGGAEGRRPALTSARQALHYLFVVVVV